LDGRDCRRLLIIAGDFVFWRAEIFAKAFVVSAEDAD